jgi:hypothetical protein
MTTVHYDPPSDSLYIAFVRGRGATGFELSYNVLARFDFLDGFPGVSREQVEAGLRTRVRWVRSPESC